MAGASSIAAEPLAVLSRYFTLETYDRAGTGREYKELVELYALRYQVYCQERNFLPADNYPDGLESDSEDERSVHFAARNDDGNVVGTARLVVGDEALPFPFERFCPPSADFQPPPAAFSAEVSRLAVSKSYRRRAGDNLWGVNEAELGKPAGDPDAVGRERRINAPLLVLGLYRQMYRHSKDNGIRYWYAAMEQSLARTLGMYGFIFTQIGEERDYYGPVRPYLGDLNLLEQQLEISNPKLLWWFRHGP